MRVRRRGFLPLARLRDGTLFCLTIYTLIDIIFYVSFCKGVVLVATAKVSRKWQVVVPKEVRDSMDLRAGDQLMFEIVQVGAQIRKKEVSAFDRYFGFLDKHSSTDEIIRKMRGKR